jgi:type I restriction enzyme S subunit
MSGEFGSDGLKPSDRKAIRGVLAQFSAIQKTVLFGSRATSTYSAASDIDLVLYGDSLTLSDELRIASRMEDLDLPLRVDLVRYATITSKALLSHIHRDGKLFYEVKGGRERAGWGSVGMPGEWRVRHLGELTENFDSLRVPVKEADRRAGPYPYYGASGIVDYVDSFLFDGEHLLIAEDGENLRTRNTPIAFLARGKFWVNNHAHIVRGNREADTRFLMYALAVADISGYLTGSTMPKLTQGNMHRLPLLAPPVDEQRAIAHILGTLDDKIELNRRMNETLEAMARALFQSWFVDFDPVRAKAEGRDPGLPKPLADLFPDSFENSELGEIPKGWKVGTVESLCDSITSGGTPARMNPQFWDEGKIPWFKTGELLDGPLIESEEHITEVALAGSSCKLWPAGTILFALYASPTVGRLGVLTYPGTSNQAAAGLIARPEFGVPFLRRLLLEARGKLQSIAVGAAQQNINQGVLKAHSAVIPIQNVASTYSRLMSVLDERQVTLSKEVNSLAALRDTLLPKLISGELRVKAAERLVAETSS